MMRRTSLLLALVAGLSAGLFGCSGSAPPASTPAPAPRGGAAEAPYFAPEAPPEFAAEGVRLAVLNAEFLFDGEGNEGRANFAHKGKPAEARAHRDEIGAVLRMLDADVIVLAEVENERVLELLIDESLAGLGYQPHFVEGRDTFTGQDVALLARVPVDTVGRTDARAPVAGSGDDYGVSKNVFARLSVGGVPTTIVGLHLLARPDDVERKPRREAQAEVIRQLVAGEMALGRAVAVVGDFNDYDEATPDREGNRPITDVLARVKAAGPGPSDDLRNVMAEVPQRERFTAFWDRDRDGAVEPGELSAIDHVLVSPRLFSRLREVVYVQAHDPVAVSDHFPIVVTFAAD